MRRRLADIEAQYAGVATDPWGTDWRGTMAVRNAFYVTQVEQAVRAFGLSGRTIRALDVGCGSGVLSRRLSDALSSACRVDQYLAVDVAQNAIAMAKRLNPGTGITFQVTREDLADLPGRAFGFVAGFEFLAYLARDERRQMLAALRSLKAPDGLVAVSSNVGVGPDDGVYLEATVLERDLAAQFQVLGRADLFLSQYIDRVEQRLLGRAAGSGRFAELWKRLLGSPRVPRTIHALVGRMATTRFPRSRNRVYVLR